MSNGIVILGAGQAGAQVAASLRENGCREHITLVGDEPHLPYQRPPLSKAYLKADLPEERLLLKPASFYRDRDIGVRLGARAIRIDTHSRRVVFVDGAELSYTSLVVATGTRPRIFAIPGLALDGVASLRSIGDVEFMRPLIERTRRIAVVGGGYIGLEVAAVLRDLGREVVVVEAEDRVLKRVTSPVVSDFYERLHADNGVEIIKQARVAAILGEKRVTGLAMCDGRTIAADAVLLAVGAVVNDDVARDAGITIDNGIVVDEFGRSSAPNVFACGDCARFPSRRFGRRVRIESVQNAIDQAKCIAATLSGKPTAHDPVPWFWSDQYRTKLQIAGLYTSGDDIAIEGDPDTGPFVVEYRRDSRLVAVDAIDNARAHMLARRRIAEATAALAAEPARSEGDRTVMEARFATSIA